MSPHLTLALILFGLSSTATLAQSSDLPTDVTDGLTYMDGVFYPIHTVAGMSYDPETKSFVDSPVPTNNPPALLADSVSPARRAELLSAYTTAPDKKSYVGDLIDSERAALYLSLFEQDVQNGTNFYSGEAFAMLEEMGWYGVPDNYYMPVVLPEIPGMRDFPRPTLTQSQQAQALEFSNFLKSMTAEQVAALNSKIIGGWGMWSVPFSGVDLSQTSLVSWDLRNANLNGALGLTPEKLAEVLPSNGTAWLDGADLRGTGITRAEFAAALEAARQNPLVIQGRSTVYAGSDLESYLDSIQFDQ